MAEPRAATDGVADGATDTMTIGVVGCGLIGTSFALALKSRRREQQCEQQILGCDANPEHARRALRRGAFDSIFESAAALAARSDIVMIATPIGATRSIFAQLAAFVDNIIITDVGSVKGSVVEDARAIFGKIPNRLVPAHPIAGTECSGPSAARADLFAACHVFLSPQAHSDSDAVASVATLWRRVGARIEYLSTTAHDKLFATTSHLPHLVAYALIAAVRQSDSNIAFSAGGLKDFTRIAASDPTMWRDIFIANGEPILNSIATFEASVTKIRRLIADKDYAQLFELLKETAQHKKRHTKHLDSNDS